MVLLGAASFLSWDFWEKPTQQAVTWLLIAGLGYSVAKLAKFKGKVWKLTKSRRVWSSIFIAYQCFSVILSGFVIRSHAPNWLRFIAWINICVYTILALLGLIAEIQLISTDLLRRHIEIAEHLMKRIDELSVNPGHPSAATPVPLQLPQSGISYNRISLNFLVSMIPAILATFIAFIY